MTAHLTLAEHLASATAQRAAALESVQYAVATGADYDALTQELHRRTCYLDNVMRAVVAADEDTLHTLTAPALPPLALLLMAANIHP